MRLTGRCALDLPPVAAMAFWGASVCWIPSHPPIFKAEILVLKLKLCNRRSCEITAALEADGFFGLDAQATALGLSRSTA
jgi:hypothetical protein